MRTYVIALAACLLLAFTLSASPATLEVTHAPTETIAAVVAAQTSIKALEAEVSDPSNPPDPWPCQPGEQVCFPIIGCFSCFTSHPADAYVISNNKRERTTYTDPNNPPDPWGPCPGPYNCYPIIGCLGSC